MARQYGRHQRLDLGRWRWVAIPAGEQQVPGADQRQRDGVDVGVGRDPPGDSASR